MTQRSFFLVSKNKVRTQLSVLKHEADTARKNAKDDVEKAKRYGIRAFGMDMLDVVDTLEKGIEAFDLHRQRFGNSLFSQEDATTTARNSTSSSPTSPTSETNTENPPSATVSTVDTEPCHTTDPISPPSTNREAELKSLESIFTGIQLSMRVLQKHLRTHGIEKIPVQCGDPFDPSVHEAMSSVPSSATLPAETIANVLKGGYKIKDRVLRPAQVVVVVAAAVGDEKDGA